MRAGTLHAVLLTLIGLTCTGSLAEAQRVEGNRAAQSAPPRPLQRASTAISTLEGRDLELVQKLDRAWNTGRPGAVLGLILCPSRPSHLELLGRVRSSQLDGPCVRKSRILSKEVSPPYRTLLLETTFSYPREKGKRQPHAVRTYELLVSKAGQGPLQGIYLVETDLDSLNHVTGKLDDGTGPYSGLSISRSTSFSCKACNYRLSLPGEGAWMIFARPSAESGLLESVELLSLEADLGLELSIVPVHRTGLAPEQRSERLLSFLDEALKVLESCSGKISSGSNQRKKTDLFGLMGWSQTVLLRDTRMGQRFYRLYGLKGASLDYMVSVHGSVDQLRKKARLASLDHCFKLLDPDRKDTEAFEIIHRLHGGVGQFKGNHYVVERLGLDITGPEGWNRFTQIGNARFVGGFDCSRSGSAIYLSGIDRPGGSWDEKSVAAWAVDWIARQKKAHGLFQNKRMTKVSIAGREGFEFLFDYPMDSDQTKTRAHGFLAMFPRGSTLVVVMGVAHPVQAQDEIMAALEKSLGSLRFE